jgi:type IV pilus assembly protein PilQ
MRLRFASVVIIAILLFSSGSQAIAATIESLNLLSDESGQSLSVGLDSPVDYQIFDLEGPSRLVLSFPGATLAKGINPVRGAGSVDKVFPTQDGSGVRLEIGLSRGVKYNITEKGNNLLISFSSQVKPQSKNQGAELVDIQVRDLAGMTELVLRGNHLDANYNALVTNDGQTMILDFWGGESKLPKEYFSYTTKRVNAVTLGSAEGRLRLVVSLMSGVGDNHQIVAKTHQMVIRFGKSVAMKQTNGLLVETVDFQPDGRIANLVIRTNDTNPIINVHEKDGNIVIDLKNARLAKGQERSQDVRAFSGPVKQLDSYTINKDVRIVARLRQKATVFSYQTGNVLTVTLKPVDLVSAQSSKTANQDEKVYSGQKVSFNYKDIDIRNALKLIAEMSDVNIIMSDDVTGLLTMRLVDVPWDQALDLILVSKGLGKEYAGNVMRIAPLAVLKEDADAKKAARKSTEEIALLETEFIQLGYASVSDVSTILKGESVVAQDSAAQSAAGGGADSSSQTGGIGAEGGLKLLSERGSILLDERSNTMIITDTRERLNNIKRLIKVIDKPMQQVLIEARIVEASDTFSRDLGVKWGGKAAHLHGPYTSTVQGKALGTNIVDLGATVGAGAGGAIGYTLGKLGGNLNLNLELSAAETEGKIKVVSSPRVFTSNLQEALIEEDRQIPFAQTTFAGGVTTTSTILISAKLTLRVTPQVTADHRIIMKLKVNKDTPIANPREGGDPSIDKKTVETKLLVKNGETVVLGGIYSQKLTNQISGVPVLRDIPWIGNLFKRKQKSDNRNELLIFITPTIIADEIYN